MTEKTVVITRKTRGSKDFAFSHEMIRKSNDEGINQVREAAYEYFKKTAIPNTREEAWRRTDLRALKPERFKLFDQAGQVSLSAVPENLLKPVADGDHGGQVILHGQKVQSKLEQELVKSGVVFCDLKSAEEKHPEFVEKVFGKIVKPDAGKFAAMAAAFADNGIFLYVPKNVVVETPLHSLIWGAADGYANIKNVLVYLEQGASVTYVHEVASETIDGGASMFAGNIEIYVGANANLRFVELQSWGRHVWNFTHERAQVDRDANLDWIFGAIGGKLTKNFADLDLIAPGSLGKMSGFYFTDKTQHLDYDSQQNHFAPNAVSDLLFKGALVEESRSVWQGMIYVAPGANKTDGYQANRNLLLSKSARADSIPGLEILADDVRCTHGATVGKIDEEQIFYLMARGIPRVDAERLIVEGFFDPIMERIPFEGVKARFQTAIAEKMSFYQG